DGGGDPGENPGPPSPPVVVEVRLSAVGGTRQVGVAGAALPLPFVSRATDTLGAPAAGVTIRWDATEGTPEPATSVTDADGVATATWRAGDAVGEARIDATAIDAGRALSEILPFTVRTVPPGPAAFLTAVPIPANYGIHDTFVRDGLAFVTAWNTGLLIYDVGNGVRGGSPGRPVKVSGYLPPAGPSGIVGAIHNAWWFHNPATGEKRYLFVGQEGPGSTGSVASGDLYVLDVSNLAAPTVVATFSIPGAGAHNVWVDEPSQVLYAAFYNGGVVAFDVSGTLGGDLGAREIARVQPGGSPSTYTWGVQLHRGSLYASDMESGFWKLATASGGLVPQGGGFNVPDRWSSDLWLHGDHAYTGTWGGIPRGTNLGDQLKIWDVRGEAPVPLGSVSFAGAGTISDVEVAVDGRTMLVTTERGTLQGLHLLSLADPAQPQVAAFAAVDRGLHTATFAEIGGRRFVFAAKNPGDPALLVYDVTGD
ncbi:MAG TPA: hypothetical protein VFX50_09620, partial [Gemmatimonadales bacterium]|nr:hypothetical protein [Gemmatimonadales bacterium]